MAHLEDIWHDLLCQFPAAFCLSLSVYPLPPNLDCESLKDREGDDININIPAISIQFDFDFISRASIIA